ncbi:pentapeptide repeat-containing protein [Bradyrhizobium sp. U87765 SZCCT0131]|uniref:ion channel n=1 Tax=unclassified Bradyrhizobium TaxID=2631580 RepID=UPI001BABE576|nr:MULTISPECIES: ion channel [unclassified Bradyrhizobium]MBR1218201.1 pentapeptide repeat-containing protein [Bradyrhizobium sp. U87765 SZCCT0131]MBR1260853.1 pentapeptide repeat-containing protein [Bradyrhizobium sp. U87765 SZCCT0134]MBR1303699.1 pentapeptide repeat-containing protein [Bradyrhizobium sp. U87765 SZCCT0110]MBR1319305.1 pentapeptide repeat-containing protein [Bradyrhizobium sp. U87765 SZCCT0109]MBR1347630.1 pentapeptide repeat-containing protein [Bradyrhizobium sp. U87765 SZCCT
MLSNFFQLPGIPTEIGDQDAFFKLAGEEKRIQSKLYRPSHLKSPQTPQRWIVRDRQFIEFSFSKTLIEEIEFNKCTFIDCLFIGSVFKNCRFSECTFISCNTYRVEFADVYLDPRSFSKCLDEERHQNIGVHLYQELLNNSRRQSQPDFAHYALFEFRRWLRLEQCYQFRKNHKQMRISRTQVKLALRIATSWAFQKFIGFGVRLRNYILTATAAASALTIFNHYFSAQLGLKINGEPLSSPIDAFYFTIITLTTIGYGDITPTSPLGRVLVAGEGIIGFVLFATLASMIYRKILP